MYMIINTIQNCNPRQLIDHKLNIETIGSYFVGILIGFELDATYKIVKNLYKKKNNRNLNLYEMKTNKKQAELLIQK